jgi:hypothetical protein
MPGTPIPIRMFAGRYIYYRRCKVDAILPTYILMFLKKPYCPSGFKIFHLYFLYKVYEPRIQSGRSLLSRRRCIEIFRLFAGCHYFGFLVQVNSLLNRYQKRLVCSRLVCIKNGKKAFPILGTYIFTTENTKRTKDDSAQRFCSSCSSRYSFLKFMALTTLLAGQHFEASRKTMTCHYIFYIALPLLFITTKIDKYAHLYN